MCRKFFYYVVLWIVALLSVGCEKQSKDSLKNMSFQILVDETGTEKVVIPAPEGKEENKKSSSPVFRILE